MKKKPIELAYVVDDDEFYVFAIRKLMDIQQFAEKVLFFPDGKEALDYFSMALACTDQLPDVIFLDINMPVMNGWEFLENFIKTSPKLPKKISIYIVTSSISDSDIKKAKSYTEVSDYLIKSLTRADLDRVFNEVQKNISVNKKLKNSYDQNI